MDEGLSRAVLKVFVDLYRADLIYKDKRLVNFDPKFGTAISDLEVVQVETKGPFVAPAPIRSRGPTDTFITVATTRPETMLGDTAVAVHSGRRALSRLSSGATRCCRSWAAASPSWPTTIPTRRKAPAP